MQISISCIFVCNHLFFIFKHLLFIEYYIIEGHILSRTTVKHYGHDVNRSTVGQPVFCLLGWLLLSQPRHGDPDQSVCRRILLQTECQHLRARPRYVQIAAQQLGYVHNDLLSALVSFEWFLTSISLKEPSI